MVEQSLFDYQPKTGAELRDEGITRAADNAEGKHPGWSGDALDMLREFVAQKEGTFMAEEIRLWCHGRGLPKPPHPRAWGNVIQRARRLDIIEFVSFGHVTNARAHCTPAAVWRRVR